MSSFAASSPPWQHSGRHTGRLMMQVVGATLPGLAVTTWFFGWGTLINVLLAALLAMGLETVMLKLRGRAPANYLRDNSALVTAVLLGIAVPPGSAWWLVALGILFAIVFAKHLYGGLGQNVFNPAMCGYVMLLLAFPRQMTSWHVPVDPANPLALEGLLASLQLSFPFPGDAGRELLVDGLAMATPLLEGELPGARASRDALAGGDGLLALLDRGAQAGWQWTGIAYMAGGLYLLSRRIITWHIPAGILGTVLLLSLLFFRPDDAGVYGSPWLHLFGGATMIGAFFIATDPVTAPITPGGRILYGILIGCSLYAIRVWGVYPDAVAFAVLTGNLSAPLLDRLTPPRIHGHSHRRGEPL